MTHDVLIVGTGPAGLAAGGYAGRDGLDTLFFEKESIGGELVNRHGIRSYPGFPDGISGTELRSKMVEEVEKYDVEVELEAVESIEPGDPHEVQAGGNQYQAKTIILAAGSHSKPLDTPGEEEYEGRGIFHCATCDGPLYQGERIAVVGGGKHAVIDAVFLTEYASEVLLLASDEELTADELLREEARADPDIDIRTNTRVTEVLGSDGVVDSLRVVNDRTDEEDTIPIGGLNVNVGSVPNTGFVEDALPLGEDGGIVVNQRMETEVQGIFAAGDVRQDSSLEIASAIGDGVTAIESAKRYL